MNRHLFTLLLVGLLICATGTGRALAKSQTKPLAPEKVKAKIASIGIGEEARVEVRLADKTKVKGYIGGVEEDHFVVIISQAGLTTRVAYADVVKVKRPFNGLDVFRAVTIIGTAVFVVLALVSYITARSGHDL